MTFLDDDTFLLTTDTSRRLYHEHAAAMPIYDYHNHLPAADLAANRTFGNLYDVWLAGDHYKWRAMRANGIPEPYCTGDADPYDKFLAFARTVPYTLRNPLYHWTHLELRRYFDIDVMLSEDTAREVWDEANNQLKNMNVAAILDKFKVAMLSMTEDPADDLEPHQQLQQSPPFDTAVVPTFRPDPLCKCDDPEAFNAYCDKLAAAAGVSIDTLAGLEEALAKRHDFFHDMGSRLSDHGLTHVPDVEVTPQQAGEAFGRIRAGQKLTATQRDQLIMHVMLVTGRLDAEKDWAKQLHLGAMRDNNRWGYENLGKDAGFDSIGDYRQAPGLARLLGTLAGEQKCPKTILYNNNPSDNYVFATMAANYNGRGDHRDEPATPGKMQLGSGWWHLDQKEGMTWQLNAFSNLGLLPRFVGMLTDGRSFLSFPRHEYFRRILCDLIGRDVAAGELPDDADMLGRVVEDICFNNAKAYFNVPLRGKYAD
jgi:glucuronate isomerase